MTRVQFEIAVGTLLVLATTAILVIIGLFEEQRMKEFEKAQQARAIEVGAGLYANNCSGCHGIKGEGIPGLCPPLNDRYFFTNRLREVGWSGSMEDYIVATVASGRVTSTRPNQYAGQGVPAMPAWSEDFGGPLRNDQIRYIAAFILNWEKTALEQVILQELPTPTPRPEELADPVVRGRRIYLERGCGGCHTIEGLSTGVVGPNLTKIGEVSATRREGYTAEQYIRESILNPNAFITQGFPENVMPQNFGDLLTPEQLDDVVAFLLAQK